MFDIHAHILVTAAYDVHVYNPRQQGHLAERMDAPGMKLIWGNLNLKLSSRCQP